MRGGRAFCLAFSVVAGAASCFACVNPSTMAYLEVSTTCDDGKTVLRAVGARFLDLDAYARSPLDDWRTPRERMVFIGRFPAPGAKVDSAVEIPPETVRRIRHGTVPIAEGTYYVVFISTDDQTRITKAIRLCP